MTQETPQKVSDMVRTTVGNASEFFNKLADHIDHLEKTRRQLQEKRAEYENLSDEESEEHKEDVT